MNATKVLLILFICTIPYLVLAQQERKLIAEGNNLYKENKYTEAEISYRKSLEKKHESIQGAFNLGDALYKQGKFEEAANQFQQITSSKEDDQTLAKAYHNLGNSLLKSKKIEESIEAYKNALKKVPNDEESKYNLSYAKNLLNQEQKKNKEKDKDKKEDQKDKNKDKDKKDKGDQKEEKEGDKKDKQDGDEGKDGKEDKENGKEDKQDKGDKKEGKNKPRNSQQLTPEDAQRMLDALNQQEKNVQKKLTKKEAQRVEIEKNW